MVWLITALLNISLGKALVFGFSKQFNRGLGGDFLFDGGSRSDEGMLFSALIIIPVTLHFIIVLYGVNARSKTVQDPDTKPPKTPMVPRSKHRAGPEEET